MKNKNIYISEVKNDEVVLSDKSVSCVYEYIPEDCGQKNDLEKVTYFSNIHQYLLNFRNVAGQFKTIRFASLGGKLFVNADRAFAENLPLKCIENSNYYKYYFKAENFSAP